MENDDFIIKEVIPVNEEIVEVIYDTPQGDIPQKFTYQSIREQISLCEEQKVEFQDSGHTQEEIDAFFSQKDEEISDLQMILSTNNG